MTTSDFGTIFGFWLVCWVVGFIAGRILWAIHRVSEML